ncbi:unnamed protein product, partial [Callosobruchus maculatus]
IRLKSFTWKGNIVTLHVPGFIYFKNFRKAKKFQRTRFFPDVVHNVFLLIRVR